MKRNEILKLAAEIAPKTSSRWTMVIFFDGSYEKVVGSYQANKRVWCEITDQCTPKELFETLLTAREDEFGLPI